MIGHASLEEDNGQTDPGRRRRPIGARKASECENRWSHTRQASQRKTPSRFPPATLDVPAAKPGASPFFSRNPSIVSHTARSLPLAAHTDPPSPQVLIPSSLCSMDEPTTHELFQTPLWSLDAQAPSCCLRRAPRKQPAELPR